MVGGSCLLLVTAGKRGNLIIDPFFFARVHIKVSSVIIHLRDAILSTVEHKL